MENGSTDGKAATRWTLLPDASSRTLDLISTSYHDFLSKIHRLQVAWRLARCLFYSNELLKVTTLLRLLLQTSAPQGTNTSLLRKQDIFKAVFGRGHVQLSPCTCSLFGASYPQTCLVQGGQGFTEVSLLLSRQILVSSLHI